MKLFYDLHLHSCLSPCGDNEMTPYNLVNMAKILGFDIIPSPTTTAQKTAGPQFPPEKKRTSPLFTEPNFAQARKFTLFAFFLRLKRRKNSENTFSA